MKRIYLLLALLCPFFSSAQSYTFEDLTEDTLQTVTEVFANVDLTQVTTGLLYDLSTNWLSPLSFTGDDLTEPIHMTADYFGMYYASLYGMATDPNNLLPGPAWYTDLVEPAENSGVVPIVMAAYRLNYFDPDAVTNNLISTANNQLVDISGPQQSPYLEALSFAAATVLSEGLSGSPTFLVDPANFRTNTGLSLTDFAFSTGGTYTTVTLGSTFTIPFGSTGPNNFRVRVTLSDGTQLYGSCGVRTLEASGSSQSGQTESRYIDAAMPHRTLVSGDIVAHVFTDCGDNNGDETLRKPLIWVEGYNPEVALIKGNKPPSDLFQRLDAADDPASGLDLTTLLESEDYDLIYIDYQVAPGDPANTEGTKDIFEIANDLVGIIEQVNADKATVGSEYKNIMVGTSMGGLVAKIALRRMELDGKKHDTERLMTFDSPHLGVNLAPSIQYAISFFSGTEVKPLAGFIYDIFTGINTPTLGEFIPALGDTEIVFFRALLYE